MECEIDSSSGEGAAVAAEAAVTDVVGEAVASMEKEFPPELNENEPEVQSPPFQLGSTPIRKDREFLTAFFRV